MVPISQWASVESINHQFQDIVHELWGQLHEIRLEELVYKEKKPNEILESVLEKLLIRSPNIASISGFAEFCDRRTSIDLSTIQQLAKFQHLESIDFSGDRVVTVENFAEFLNSSASRQSLRRLDIYGGIYGEMKSNNAVGSSCKNQPALNLEYLKFNMRMLIIFDHFLQPIEWLALKELVILDSCNCGKEVLAIIRQCTQVVYLEIKIPHCGNYGQPSYVDFMRGVADLENLSILKISCHGSSVHDFPDPLLVLLQHLGRRRRRIIELSLLKFYYTDQIVGPIIDHLPQLKSLELDVKNCTKLSLERLANEMVQLECLKFRSRCGSKVDGAIIRAIGCNMTNLKFLHLDYPSPNCKDFTSLANLRNLKELRVRGRFMNCATIEAWNGLGFGSNMETLELLLHEGITPEAMGDLLKKMPRLRWMQLWGVTDAILYSMAESCPNLVDLELWGSLTITSTGIQSVINRCGQLKILKVFGHDKWFPAGEWENIDIFRYFDIRYFSKFSKYSKYRYFSIFRYSIFSILIKNFDIFPLPSREVGKYRKITFKATVSGVNESALEISE